MANPHWKWSLHKAQGSLISYQRASAYRAATGQSYSARLDFLLIW